MARHSSFSAVWARKGIMKLLNIEKESGNLGPQEERGFIQKTTHRSRTERGTPADGRLPEGPQGLSPGRNTTGSQFTPHLNHLRNQPYDAVTTPWLRQQRTP
eukprot:447283-Pyramimonas_sp.AAC.1